MKLKSPLNFTKFIQPVVFPGKEPGFIEAQLCLISGWGLVKTDIISGWDLVKTDIIRGFGFGKIDIISGLDLAKTATKSILFKIH